jgi:hypothetical protein
MPRIPFFANFENVSSMPKRGLRMEGEKMDQGVCDHFFTKMTKSESTEKIPG